VVAALSVGQVLAGLSITARETTLVFHNNDPLAQLLESKAALDKDAVKKLAEFPKPQGGVATNEYTRTYQFQDDEVLVTAKGLNVETRQLGEATRVTSKAVFRYRTFLARDGGTNGTCLGEISPRNGNSPVGWPCFLSKRALAEWVAQSPDDRCAREETSQGVGCYALTLPAPTGTPIRYYRLRVRASDLSPVELVSYSQDGQVYSTSELEFDGNVHSSLCKRARTRVFSGGAVFTDSIWEIVGVERIESSAMQDLDSFFPVGTLVSDQRFAKPIVYRQGVRPPNVSEVQAMLASPRGVAIYESATHSEAQLAKLKVNRARHRAESKTRQNVVRIAACAVLLVPLVWGVLAWRRRQKCRLRP